MKTRADLRRQAGYVTAHKTACGHGDERGWVVAYLAEAQGIDPEDGGKYAVVCDLHGTIVQVGAKKEARRIARDGGASFCDCCRGTCTDHMFGAPCPNCDAVGTEGCAVAWR